MGISWDRRIPLFARSRRPGIGARYLRPADHSPLQNLGGRRANPRLGGFYGKNNFARRYRRIGLGLDRTGKRNRQMGLDESNRLGYGCTVGHGNDIAALRQVLNILIIITYKEL
jgi:hypothetical protein